MLFTTSAKVGGRVEKSIKTDPTYPKELFYCVQHKAWFDEKTMLLWVDNILAPYVATAPEGIVPILFLDAFSVHLMESVVSRIQELGVEVVPIPGGCTCVVQPVDVGFNKPFKSAYRANFRSWLVQKAMLYGTIQCPERQQVAKWVVDASCYVSQQTIRNSWRKDGFEWFPKDVGTADDLKWYDREWLLDEEDEEEIEVPLCAI